MRRSVTFVLVAAALLAAACETPSPRSAAPAPVPQSTPPRTATRPPQPPPPPAEPAKPPVPVKTAPEIALDDGQALYEAGSYNEAIKSLQGAREIWDGPDAIKVRAHKLIAFSHCVLGRRTLCRQQFTDALKLDPTFALEPAERTHPIWGVEFEAAKKALAAPARAPATSRPPAGAPVRPGAPAGTPSSPVRPGG